MKIPQVKFTSKFTITSEKVQCPILNAANGFSH